MYIHRLKYYTVVISSSRSLIISRSWRRLNVAQLLIHQINLKQDLLRVRWNIPIILGSVVGSYDVDDAL